MKVIRSLSEVPRPAPRITAAIGSFDGVHAGHREIMTRVVREARRSGGAAAVFTFDPHPRAVLQAPRSPRILTPLDEKIGILASLGIELTVVLRFDRAFASMPAEEFVRVWLLDRFRPGLLVVGYDFRLGRGREGNGAMLKTFGEGHGFAVDVVDPYLIDGRPVKSTWIRDEIEAGEVRTAARLLRRFHAIAGTVVPGDSRGKGLGFPTANLSIEEEGKLWPGDGVYAVFAEVGESLIEGAANLGVRPTFGPGGARRLEVHLFGFEGDLEGARLRVHFVEKVRGETRFRSPEDLVRRIRADCDRAAEILAAADRKFLFTRP